MLLVFLSVVIVVLFATVVIAFIIVIITIVISSVVSCTNSRFSNSSSPQVNLAFYNSSPIHSVTTLAMKVLWKLHLLLFYLTEMATHGKMFSFDPNKEQWISYTKRLDFYFEANNVTSVETKRAMFLTVWGPSTFQLLKSWYNLTPQKKRGILN